MNNKSYMTARNTSTTNQTPVDATITPGDATIPPGKSANGSNHHATSEKTKPGTELAKPLTADERKKLAGYTKRIRHLHRCIEGAYRKHGSKAGRLLLQVRNSKWFRGAPSAFAGYCHCMGMPVSAARQYISCFKIGEMIAADAARIKRAKENGAEQEDSN